MRPALPEKGVGEKYPRTVTSPDARAITRARTSFSSLRKRRSSRRTLMAGRQREPTAEAGTCAALPFELPRRGATGSRTRSLPINSRSNPPRRIAASADGGDRTHDTWLEARHVPATPRPHDNRVHLPPADVTITSTALRLDGRSRTSAAWSRTTRASATPRPVDAAPSQASRRCVMAPLWSCQRSGRRRPFPGMRQHGGKGSNRHHPGWNRGSWPIGRPPLAPTHPASVSELSKPSWLVESRQRALRQHHGRLLWAAAFSFLGCRHVEKGEAKALKRQGFFGPSVASVDRSGSRSAAVALPSPYASPVHGEERATGRRRGRRG
jgi:hypothetical protein